MPSRCSRAFARLAAAQAAIREWHVTDETVFHEHAIATIVDHGCGLPIFPAHWLKTWSAVRDELAAGLPASARTAMLAAVNRLLAVRFKQRHALRTAHQALGFVGRGWSYRAVLHQIQTSSDRRCLGIAVPSARIEPALLRSRP